MKKTNTSCCALAQLSGLNNDTTEQELLIELLKLKEESDKEYTPGDSSGLGQRCIFVITTPEETNLASLLQKVGFRKTHVFPRRNGYPEGLLKMYTLNL